MPPPPPQPLPQHTHTLDQNPSKHYAVNYLYCGHPRDREDPVKTGPVERVLECGGLSKRVSVRRTSEVRVLAPP